MAAPLVLWMATGVLFHVKHRYDEAYEPLSMPAPAPSFAKALLAPGDVVARGLLDDGRIRLAAHPTGAVAYYGTRDGKARAVDAATGEPIALASEDAARSWAGAAVAASPHRDRYGAATAAEEGTHPSALTSADDPAFVFTFDGGKRVTVDRISGEMSQEGDLNAWIDFTYKVHYLQWTPWQPVNVVLVLAAVPLVLFLAASGFFLATRSR